MIVIQHRLSYSASFIVYFLTHTRKCSTKSTGLKIKTLATTHIAIHRVPCGFCSVYALNF